MITPSDIAWASRVITRNQLAAQRAEHDERAAWLRHEINTALNIVTVEAIADKLNDGIRNAMPCDCRAMGSRVRCGSCRQ